MHAPKRVGLVLHPRRDSGEAVAAVLEWTHRHGATLVGLPDEVGRIDGVIEEVPAEDLADCDLLVSLGGDGTMLRALRLSQPTGVPVLGVNLGRVGFLAETEQSSLGEALDSVCDGEYAVEERMTLDALVRSNGTVLARTWALNEAVVEKGSRERILEVVLEVDGRPVSAFGCDGVLCATPTGSTAYAFSAGGPLVWPQVEALLLVPSNAHALFARPMVISPDSSVAIEIDVDGPPAVLDCDGRRTVPLPPGARVELSRGGTPVRMVRLDGRPFADRLVRKFDLPVRGWRGAPRP